MNTVTRIVARERAGRNAIPQEARAAHMVLCCDPPAIALTAAPSS
jgi:hypothetical protein